MIFEALCAYAVYKGAKKVSAWNKKVVGNKKVIKAKKAKTNKIQQAKNRQVVGGIIAGVALLPLLSFFVLSCIVVVIVFITASTFSGPHRCGCPAAPLARAWRWPPLVRRLCRLQGLGLVSSRLRQSRLGRAR